jgi:L-amino acid N-acyltransferase YncA
VIVRAATTEDLPSILEIYNEAVLNTTATAETNIEALETRQAWFAHRQKLSLPVFVADEDGRVVGWSSLSSYSSRTGYRFTAEDSIYVAADCRGRGIGKALLAALVSAAKERGIHSLVAKIDGENAASIYLHEQIGFSRAGLLTEAIYKFDRWLNVVYMQLML